MLIFNSLVKTQLRKAFWIYTIHTKAWRPCFFARFLVYCIKIMNMTENEISRIVVNVCYKIHTKLGPGLLESVYEAILYYELTNRGLKVE